MIRQADPPETEDQLLRVGCVRVVRHRYIRTARHSNRTVRPIPVRDRWVTEDLPARAGKARYIMQVVPARGIKEIEL